MTNLFVIMTMHFVIVKGDIDIGANCRMLNRKYGCAGKAMFFWIDLSCLASGREKEGSPIDQSGSAKPYPFGRSYRYGCSCHVPAPFEVGKFALMSNYSNMIVSIAVAALLIGMIVKISGFLSANPRS
jgi:hypothetical protein